MLNERRKNGVLRGEPSKFYNQVAVRLVLLVIVINKLRKNFFVNESIPSKMMDMEDNNLMIFCYKTVLTRRLFKHVSLKDLIK